jgi:hypothetical protein
MTLPVIADETIGMRGSARAVLPRAFEASSTSEEREIAHTWKKINEGFLSGRMEAGQLNLLPVGR